MEGGGFNLFGGGDPEEFLRAMQEAMERAGEQQAEVQTKHFAQETLDTAVELTSAALGQIEAQGSVDEQAIALRDAMRVLFPEAVALVSAARQGLMRDS
jgi:hypothetical protein